MQGLNAMYRVVLDYMLQKTNQYSNFPTLHEVYASSSAHQASCSMGNTSPFPDGKEAGESLTTQIPLLPRLRMSAATPPIPLYDFLVCEGKKSFEGYTQMTQNDKCFSFPIMYK